LESPCKNICHLDAVTGFCDGCGRTGLEIASWINLTPAERRVIMAALDQRMIKVRSAKITPRHVAPSTNS
jgi:uncharacterized protein